MWRAALVLFALAAWPLLLVDVPPLQDLSNHLATAAVLRHPELYPEYVANGFFKTNSALFAWLHFLGPVVGANVAARLFVGVVLALGAFALPWITGVLSGRASIESAALLAWPFVHHWFVSTGMLDFALAFALALVVLGLLAKGRRVAAGLVAVVAWYAHVFPLLVVYALLALDVAPLRHRAKDALALLPSAALCATSILAQLAPGNGELSAGVVHRAVLPAWDLVYNLWAECAWGFTRLSATSLLPAVVLAVYAVRRPSEARFFGRRGLLALAVGYAVAPYIATNWYYVNSRLAPFLAVAALVRVPARLPRALAGALVAAAVAYSAGMAVDYVRLAREREELAAGVDVVPARARLLPLLFQTKGASENTRHLLHAWGAYVVARQTSAPLLFAHSRSFPLTYREPPPPQLNHVVLESFAPTMASPDTACRLLRDNGVAEDCDAAFRARWSAFWELATPRFDHLLLWEATPEAVATIPAAYSRVEARGRLLIYRRVW